MSKKPPYKDDWYEGLRRGQTQPSSSSAFSSFEGVTARVFPLKADLRCLQNFCRKYYNIVPNDIADFRPALPFIYLAVIHYAKMQPRESREWISQNEVAFVIPLEWHREENGQMVFYDWAYATPFIFVDDDISLMLGREVYGWPKIAAKVEQTTDPWVTHPRYPTSLMTLTTAGFLSASLRKAEKPEKLLEITLDPAPSALQLQPDPNILKLFLDGPRTMLDSVAAMWEGIGALTGISMPGNRPPSDWQAQADMMATNLRRLGAVWSDISREQLAGALFPGVSYQDLYKELLKKLGKAQPGSPNILPSNQITMKQFRDASAQDEACYQGLVNSQIKVLGMENGGLLGDVNYLRGDPTGGFQVRLQYKTEGKDEHGVYKNTGELILKELGLQGVEEKKDNHSVMILKPLYPFWAAVDLQYGQAETLCWRAHSLEWKPEAITAQAGQRRRRTARLVQPIGKRPLFNGAAGGTLGKEARPVRHQAEVKSTSQDSQKRRSPTMRKRPCSSLYYRRSDEIDVLLNIYPLQANPEQLRVLCNKYLAELNFPQTELRDFEPDSPYVYLTIVSTKEDGQIWAPGEIGFYVPIKWKNGNGELEYAVITPFVYWETDVDAIIDREINGRPAQDGDLEMLSVGQSEFSPNNADTDVPLFTVKTEVFPKGKSGESVKEELLVEILRGEKPSSYRVDVSRLKGDLKKSVIKNLTVKQFREADDPQRACYQALIEVTWKLEDVVEIKEIKEGRMVKIYEHDFPSIAETLGLIPNDNELFPVLAPFSIQMRTPQNWQDEKTLFWRAGSLDWQVEEKGEGLKNEVFKRIAQAYRAGRKER